VLHYIALQGCDMTGKYQDLYGALEGGRRDLQRLHAAPDLNKIQDPKFIEWLRNHPIPLLPSASNCVDVLATTT